MSRASRCSENRRCRSRACDYCGPIRFRDSKRKFRDNLTWYGGRTFIIAVTAPGQDVLPWDDARCAERGSHKHSGADGCRVLPAAGYTWNRTASDRYRRLWDAATESADRLLRSHGYRGRLPRRVASVWAPQGRGVWHVHEALPAATAIERVWSRHVVAYIHRRGGEYGWGYVDRNPLRYAYALSGSSSSDRVASYLARNAAGYLASNGAAPEWLPGRWLREYVSRRLTTVTGVTMRSIRDAHYLWAIITFGLEEPAWFADQSRLERAWSVLIAPLAARPPPGAPAPTPL